MLKKILAVAIGLMFLVTAVVVLWRVGPEKEPETTLPTPPPVSPINPPVIPPVITALNFKNEKIRSLVASDMEIKYWQNGRRFRLSGRLYFEKKRHFRMVVDSIVGQELDLGSNDTHFWYWSKRDVEPGLHYAAHSDFHKTRLKTPFNPMLMQASLGLEIIDVSNAKITEDDQRILVTNTHRSATGQTILYTTFISKKTQLIDGFVVTSQEGKKLVTCEIRAHNGDTPTEILYIWYEENKTMQLKLGRTKLNEKISDSIWRMPNYGPKINIAED